jgi:Uma2 family endonuclease
VTVEEFRRREDPPGFRLELHNGEVVSVTPPKYQHGIIQLQLTLLLARDGRIDRNDNLSGSPDIVVEVLSQLQLHSGDA